MIDLNDQVAFTQNVYNSSTILDALKEEILSKNCTCENGKVNFVD